MTESINDLSKLIKLKRIEQKNALKILLLNLFICPSEKIRTPRAKKSLGSKRYNPLKIGYGGLRSALNALNEHELVIQEIGLKDVESGTSKMTTVLTTQKLRDWFVQHNWNIKDISFAEKELVVLRANNESKDLLDYVDGERTKNLREELRKYNQLLNSSEIILVSKNDKVERQFDFRKTKENGAIGGTTQSHLVPEFDWDKFKNLPNAEEEFIV